MAEEAPQPSEAEVLQQLEAELRKLKVADILAQTVYTVSSLAWRRLAPGEERDLDEARLAIDALGALLPVLEQSLPPEGIRDFNQVTSNLKLAYAKAATEAGAAS